MAAQSQAQRGLIFGKRNQYKTKAKTPDKWKWIWDEDWENKGKLPEKKKKNETVQNVVMEDYRARTVNESIYGKNYVSDDTRPKNKKVKEPYENWTLELGDKVVFDIKDQEWVWANDEPEIAKIALSHDGKVATILGPATATEVGIREHEYYDIEFDDGEELYAVSGYHLVDI